MSRLLTENSGRYRDVIMTRGDILKLLGAVAGLVAVVALISPPTRPMPAPAGDWRKQLPVKTGTPAPAPSTASVPATAFDHRPAPVPPRVDEGNQAGIDQPPAPAIAADRDDRFPPDDELARRFRQGYHWGERNGIHDERDCYRAADDPFTDGCLAAMTDDDRASAYPPARYRPYR